MKQVDRIYSNKIGLNMKPKSVDYNFVIDLEVKLETEIFKLKSEVERLKKENETLRDVIVITDERNLPKQKSVFSFDEIKVIKDYIEAESNAKEAKDKNDRASMNFNKGGESGAYSSPTSVIDCHFKWIEKAFNVCTMIKEKLDL